MLIVSASDFVADGWLHGRMAVLRGVEGGFSIVRSANLGILTATDDRGRILAELDTIMGPPFVTLIENVPVRHELTIYSRFGDWFAWLCMAMVSVGLLSSRWSRSTHAGQDGTAAPMRGAQTTVDVPYGHSQRE